ncbi:MAG: hypothetical protein ACTIH2_06995 [Anaerococcus sp.]
MLFIDKLYCTVIGTFIFLYIYFSLIPTDEKNLRKFYHRHHNRIGIKYEDYDWKETILRERMFFNILQVYLTGFFIFSKVVGEWNGKLFIGEWIAKIGLISCFILALAISSWADPVKK